jgi:hypothetical protein
MVEIANKANFAFDRLLDAKQQSHELRRTVRPLTHWLKKTSDEKRGSTKMQGVK